MFSLFKVKDIEHPRLGTLHWRRGYWEASLSLPGMSAVRVLISGTKNSLLPNAEAEALRLPSASPEWKAKISQALFEHAEPYLSAMAEDPESNSLAAEVRSPSTAWDKAVLQAVVVHEIGGVMTSEFCFAAAWDEEHTLGARFQGGQWWELCGSTLVP